MDGIRIPVHAGNGISIQSKHGLNLSSPESTTQPTATTTTTTLPALPDQTFVLTTRLIKRVRRSRRRRRNHRLALIGCRRCANARMKNLKNLPQASTLKNIKFHFNHLKKLLRLPGKATTEELFSNWILIPPPPKPASCFFACVSSGWKITNKVGLKWPLVPLISDVGGGITTLGSDFTGNGISAEISAVRKSINYSKGRFDRGPVIYYNYSNCGWWGGEEEEEDPMIWREKNLF